MRDELDDGGDQAPPEWDEATFDAPPPAHADVRDLLRAAAGADPGMPADVVARLDIALRAARDDSPAASHGTTTTGRSVVPVLTDRRRTRVRRVRHAFAIAAGVAVLTGGAVALVSALPSGSSSMSSGSSAADSSGGGDSVATAALPAGVKLLRSDTDYADTTTVRAAAENLLDNLDEPRPMPAQRPPEVTPGTRDDIAGQTPPAAPTAPRQPDSGVEGDTSQLPAAQRAVACTNSLGVEPASVVAVQVATWRSQPAALVVHTTATGAEVVVVALDCSPGAEALSRTEVPTVARTTTATPSPS